ncbi:MAG: hypothetical protein RLZZ621_1245, partial [Gemmatimonadota bacterium]
CGIAGDRARNRAREGLDPGDDLVAREPDECARAANSNDRGRRAASASRACAVVEGVVLLVECELGIGERCRSTGVTAADVLAATESVAPCFEIVDSRIDDWKISIVDTVADNASCGVYVIGKERLDPAGLDLPNLHVTVTKNGAPLSEGYGHAVQGDPAQAVAWLANTLGAYGVTLNAGDVILSGSLVPLADAVKGDRFEMTLSNAGGPLGTCVANFV